MTEDDIKHLAKLARIELSEKEVDSYRKEFNDILGFVEQIKSVSVDGGGNDYIESAGVRNVFREDQNSHESGEYTKDILNNAPEKEKGFVKVQKILNANDSA
jgi:aspartyl/glutamyl-tRNA(Asn/Gln) amidotransferase C subunit